MESWKEQFLTNIIAHSAKGTTWGKHKYIRKEGDKYIYPPLKSSLRDHRIDKTDSFDLDDDDRKNGYLEDDFVDKFRINKNSGDNVHVYTTIRGKTQRYSQDDYGIGGYLHLKVSELQRMLKNGTISKNTDRKIRAQLGGQETIKDRINGYSGKTRNK